MRRDRYGSIAGSLPFAAFVFALLMMTACTPYARLGLGYQIDAHTDYWQQTDRDWQCENPSFNGEVGLTNGRAGIALAHDSWVLCGGLNDRAESYANRIEAWVQFGGVK